MLDQLFIIGRAFDVGEMGRLDDVKATGNDLDCFHILRPDLVLWQVKLSWVTSRKC